MENTTVKKVFDGSHHLIQTEMGITIATIAWRGNAEASARRIVAAVNACAGISTFDLETLPINFEAMAQDRLQLQAEVTRLRAENERLRDALGKIARHRHRDKSCSLEAQGYTQVECAEIGAKDWLAGIAFDALSETTPATPAPVKPEPINAQLLEVLKEADEYLSENNLNQIGHKSILHSKMISAIAAAEAKAHQQQKSKCVTTPAPRLFEAMRNLVAHLREKYPWYLSEPLNSLLIEAEASLHDPNGWEPRGIIQFVNPSGPFTSDDVQKFMTEAEYTRQIGHLKSAIRHFVGASRFAMRLLSQNEGDALAQACVSELAQAINRVTTYGPSGVIQERPRPEEPDGPDPCDLARDYNDALRDAEAPTPYDP